MAQEAIASFICPITSEIMEDPVVDNEGNSYERSAIERWIRTSPYSPLSRNPLRLEHLRPNLALRHAIEEYLTKCINESAGSDSGFAMPAWNFESIDLALEGVAARPTTDDVNLDRILDQLFFAKPRQTLREVQSAGKMSCTLKGQKQVKFSTAGIKGQDGIDGQPGVRGAEGGGNGTNGRDGISGQPGGASRNLFVSILSIQGQNVFLATPDYAQDCTAMALWDERTTLTLTTLGGEGGRGGCGGDGGHGADGRKGQDATRSGCGTSGTNGGNGGNGGDGAHGGNSAHSSDITVVIKEIDTDLLYLVIAECSSVKGGRGGRGGSGGKAGIGGTGGASCEWTERVRCGTDSDGRAVYETLHRCNPGGATGANGIIGSSGSSGTDGLDGSAGIFRIKILASSGGVVDEYQEIFKLMLKGFRPIRSPTGIIEPGQRVEISHFEIQNASRMPSPSKNILLGLEKNRYLVSKKFFYMPGSVRGLSTLALDPSLNLDFTVLRQEPLDAGKVMFIDTSVEVKAGLARIERCVRQFHPIPYPVHIEYPVQLSIVKGCSTCVPSGLVPVAFKLRNHSLLGLGEKAPHPRRLEVTLNLLNANAAQLCPKFDVCEAMSANQQRMRFLLGQGEGPTIVVHFLAAGSELLIAGFLSLNPPPERLHEELQICFTLRIGDVQRPMEDTVIVQKEVHCVQLAEHRHQVDRAVGTSSMLLVISCSTTKHNVDYWRAIADNMKTPFYIWNASIYAGFSFIDEQYKIMESFTNGVVVILDDPFLQDHELDQVESSRTPSSFLGKLEIFEAARYQDVRTLLVHGSSQPSNVLPTLRPLHVLHERSSSTKGTKSFPNIKTYADYVQKSSETHHDNQVAMESHYVTIKSNVVGQPSQKLIEDKMMQLQNALIRALPGQQYYFLHSFNPKKVKACCVPVSSLFELGEIEIRRGLDTTRATVAARKSGVTDDVNADSSALLKLLPLSTKLQLFDKGLCQELVPQLILSDLVDEQRIIYKHIKTHGDIEPSRLSLALPAMSAFSKHDFSVICQRSNGAGALQDILVKLRYLASFYSVYTYKNNSRSIKGYMRTACVEMLGKYFPNVTALAFRNLRKTYKSRKSSLDDVFKTFSDPFKLTGKFVFNHWDDLGEFNMNGSLLPSNQRHQARLRQSLHENMGIAEMEAVARKYMNRCQYRRPPPPLYANELGEQNPEPASGNTECVIRGNEV